MPMDSSSPFSSSSSRSVTRDVADFGKRCRRARYGIGGIGLKGGKWEFGIRLGARGFGGGSNQTEEMEAMKVKARGPEEDNRKTLLRLILKAVAGLQLDVLAVDTGNVK